MILFFQRHPSAILRRVIPVVINTIKRVSPRRLWPHVLKKGFKAVNPLLAHRNAPPAVMGVARPIFVETSIFHADPRIPFGGSRKPVCGEPFSAYFEVETTARFGISIAKSKAKNVGLTPTFAYAMPKRIFGISFSASNDAQTVEFQSSKVFEHGSNHAEAKTLKQGGKCLG